MGEKGGEATETSLLRGLTAQQQRDVLGSGATRRLTRGQTLFHQDDPAEVLCLVEDGRLKLAQTTAAGALVTVRVTGPGELCAAIAVLDGKTYPFTATALEPTRVRLWSRRVLQGHFSRMPRLQSNLLEIVGAHARESLDRFRELATEPVSQRLARALLRLVRQASRPQSGGRLIEGVTLQDRAEVASTTLYTVSRVLADWQAAGLLTKTRGRILVRSEEGLRASAEPEASPRKRS